MKKKIILILAIKIVFCAFAFAKIKVFAPATPSSIPLIMAVKELDNFELELFENHSKAHSLFLKGEVDVLSTGLTVGKKFYEQEIPLKIINSYVSGLTYLVTADRKISNFSDLKGEKIYLPFQGSPIDEITKYFIKKEGLIIDKDIELGYMLFPSTIKLMKMGKIDAAVFPEPFVSVLEKDGYSVSLNYATYWKKINSTEKGYPQVGTFVKKDFYRENENLINDLNNEIAKAIVQLKQTPDKAVSEVSSYFKFPKEILIKSIGRVEYEILTGRELKKAVDFYYKKINKPLDETYKDFF